MRGDSSSIYCASIFYWSCKLQFDSLKLRSIVSSYLPLHTLVMPYLMQPLTSWYLNLCIECTNTCCSARWQVCQHQQQPCGVHYQGVQPLVRLQQYGHGRLGSHSQGYQALLPAFWWVCNPLCPFKWLVFSCRHIKILAPHFPWDTVHLNISYWDSFFFIPVYTHTKLDFRWSHWNLIPCWEWALATLLERPFCVLLLWRRCTQNI